MRPLVGRAFAVLVVGAAGIPLQPDGNPIERGLDPVPLLPVSVAPFWLDTLEMTVGRFRRLAGRVTSVAPVTKDPANQFDAFCTYLGEGDASNDALPLNCVTWELATEVCTILGGSLPSEAEWEHAARGRGQRRRFPWGDLNPACCTTSAGRKALPMIPQVCPGAGLEPAGSHPAKQDCPGLGDVSRDGILDLGGGVREWTRDAYRPYGHPCWGVGLGVDRVCEGTSLDGGLDGGDGGDGDGGDGGVALSDIQHTTRGGAWSAGPTLALAALRSSLIKETNETGFRCRYVGRR